MSENKTVCPFCESMWTLIRKDEDEVFRMKRSARSIRFYKNTIKQLEAELQRRYRIVKECREKNHPEEMY